MTKRAQTIARRLVEAQQTAAMLTTFNEVDMTAIMALRERRKESFKKEFGVGLGIASFFVKARHRRAARVSRSSTPRFRATRSSTSTTSTSAWPSAPRAGLVVPVIRDADRMSFPQIELAIRDFAKKARRRNADARGPAGGTFTITNGGVFGSLLSTPILNPPQVAILSGCTRSRTARSR